MGDFKEKNGKTRVGAALNSIKAFMKSKGMEVALDFADDVFPPLKVISSVLNSKASEISSEDAEHLEVLLKNYDEERAYHLGNTESAREMYAEKSDTADFIAHKVIKENLISIALLVIIQVLAIIFVEGPVAAVITGVIGTIVGALINERNTVINFFFGSSKGSKDKDAKKL